MSKLRKYEFTNKEYEFTNYEFFLLGFHNYKKNVIGVAKSAEGDYFCFVEIVKMKPPVRRNDLLYPELSYQLVGCAYEVFNELGPGHSEKTYQRAYAVMLRKNNISFIEQAYYPVRFKNEIVSRGFLDFEIEKKIIVELKRGDRYSKTHIDQVVDYIKRSGLLLAILINFTTQGVTYKRLININQPEVNPGT